MNSLLFLAEATAETLGGLPWFAVSAVATVIVTVVTVLWRTSEGRVAKLLDLQERTLLAIATNTAALESLRDALDKPE